jgi:hypothetical protein
MPLFSEPTGLADGLAPKERRYELLRARFAPGDSLEPPTGSPVPTWCGQMGLGRLAIGAEL